MSTQGPSPAGGQPAPDLATILAGLDPATKASLAAALTQAPAAPAAQAQAAPAQPAQPAAPAPAAPAAQAAPAPAPAPGQPAQPQYGWLRRKVHNGYVHALDALPGGQYQQFDQNTGLWEIVSPGTGSWAKWGKAAAATGVLLLGVAGGALGLYALNAKTGVLEQRAAEAQGSYESEQGRRPVEVITSGSEAYLTTNDGERIPLTADPNNAGRYIPAPATPEAE